MNATSGWGVWVNNNNNGSFIPLTSLGLVAGNGYTFKMDMRIEAGSPSSNLGKLKLEWQGGGVFGPNQPTLVNNNWNTYTWNVIIPAGVTGMKIVPVNENGSIVGFDNIGFESVPYYVAPLPPQDVVLDEKFDVASPNWQPVTGPAAPQSTTTWTTSVGNPPGATTLAVAGTGAPSDAFFSYVATGVNFGDGPVEISFDGKLLSGLPGTAIHVLYNGNFVGAIMNSLNQTTYTTVKRTFNLNQGFTSTTTFNLTFQFAMGPVAGNGGSVSIDNIKVKTNLPNPPPVNATIKQGTEIGWTAANGSASYQPQESIAAGGPWTNVGTPISGASPSTRFDETPSAFYQVVENIPAVYNNGVANPGFETAEVTTSPADDWNTVVAADGGVVSVASSFPGGYVPRGGSKMLVLEVHTGEVGSTGPSLAEVRSSQIAVTAGTTYNFSFHALNVLTDIGTDAQYTFYYYDEFGVPIETPVITSFSAVGGEWTKVQTTRLIPNGVGFVVVAFRLATGPILDLDWVALIDDVSLDTGVIDEPAQTNPLAATKTPAVEISWNTQDGSTYQVESSLNLTNWSNFGNPVAGDGSVYSVIDPLTPASKFFRVLESTP